MAEQRLKDKVASLRADADALEQAIQLAVELEGGTTRLSNQFAAVWKEVQARDYYKEPTYRATPQVKALLERSPEVVELTDRERWVRIAALAVTVVERIDKPGC